jgi:putative addiction module killer protein
MIKCWTQEATGRRLYSIGYIGIMVSVLRTTIFDDWMSALRDPVAKSKIIVRIHAMEGGHLGDWKPIGDGVSELRVHSGPGYRVYFGRRGTQIYLLLCGGVKTGQSRDIARAKALWRELEHDL